MQGFSKGRENKMFKCKNLIMLSMLLVILASTSIMAVDGGSAKFVVTRPLFAAGTEVKVGQYDVKWQPGTQTTEVTFAAVGKSLEIKLQGKIEEVETKYDYNSMVIGKDSAGREAIKQLQFSGKKIRIVFE
jgi:hypothetical protein